jgi:predicted PurR-regulated permease PerM
MTSPRTWTVAALIALVVGVWFLWPQLSVVVLTVLMAFMFYPLYLKLKKKKGNGVVAASVHVRGDVIAVFAPLWSNGR